MKDKMRNLIKKITIIKVINSLCILLSVALIATTIKCAIVGASIDSQASTVTSEVVSTDTESPAEVVVEYVLPDVSDMPIVIDTDVDLSKYNIAKAAPYHEEYNGDINVFTDLEARMDISEQEIRKIIEYWTEEEKSTTLKDKSVAAAFIYAAQQTNLDPVFLLSLAGQESGWGTSKLHYDTKNPYSIGFQDDGYLDIDLGDTYQESIIQGAIWIRENFYDTGATSLYYMEYGEYPYATDTNWMADIAEIMNISYQVMLDINTDAE